jgi:hypothetical protein
MSRHHTANPKIWLKPKSLLSPLVGVVAASEG